MPITKDKFQRIDDEGIRPESNAEQILEFLVRNEDKAYTQSEIAEETGVKRGSVGPTLKRLKDRSAVEHKANYWRVSEEELVTRSSVALTSETASQYDEEEFDVEKWAEYAVDPPEYSGENE
ncbi:MarR family transcriptional regulator [Halorussus caseinilyticus]|uniref:MarR family transcriptional regulator n=1 Tax=Halorussus caseinilyticus TaxID=3034025 RepID=A0ABD5WWI1_9EURY|nr:helix-turn-helix domain-containing protein [Halorussus sp. DT72]